MKKVYFTFLLIAIHSFCNPTGEKVVSGEASFSRQNAELKIDQKTDKAIVNWDKFSIQNGEKTTIFQPSSKSVLLNRVVGQVPTSINGILEANGKIYLINPKGIIVGKEGHIKSAGFLASTLDTTDSDFLAGQKKFSGETLAAFENKGHIETTSGNIYIFAPTIVNNGTISSEKDTIIAAGQDVYFVSENNEIKVQVSGKGSICNEGLIEAKKAFLKSAGGDLSQLAINQKGLIKATGILEKDGEVYLVSERGSCEVSGSIIAKKNDCGGTVHILGENVALIEEATIDASNDFGGGEILIGGDYQGVNPNIKTAKNNFVDENVFITASANIDGNGGKIILWADEGICFKGKIQAEGGIKNGDGGFVEISSHGFFSAPGKVSTFAKNGKIGTLLYDPSDITISAAATNPPGSFPSGSTLFDPVGASGTLNATELVDNGLALNNVTVQTTSGIGGNGTITISESFTWSQATKLTLKADASITIDPGVTVSNTSPITGFDAVDFTANGTVAGNYSGIDIRGSISADGGNIKLTGTGGNTGNDNNGIYITFGTVTTGAGNITLEGYGNGDGTGLRNKGIFIENVSASNFATTSGNITLKGYGRNGLDRCYGINLNNSTITSATGNIYFEGSSVNPTRDFNHGIVVENISLVSSVGSGNITFEGDVSNTSRDQNYAVYIDNSKIEALSVSSSPKIDIRGTSESAGFQPSDNRGIYFLNNAEVNNSKGEIYMQGICTIPTTNNFGIEIINSDVTNSGGNIKLIGDAYDDALKITGGATVTNTSGEIYLEGKESIAGAEVNIGDCTIQNDTGITKVLAVEGVFSLLGLGGVLGSQFISNNLIEFYSIRSIVIGTGSTATFNTTSDIKFISQRFDYNVGPATLNITTTGDVVFLPYVTDGTMGIDYMGGYDFNIEEDALYGVANNTYNFLSFGEAGFGGNIIVGDGLGGTLTLNQGNTRFSGNTVDILNPINAGSYDVNCQVGNTASSIFDLNETVTTTGQFSLEGGSFSDRFNFNIKIPASVNGGGGNNTLYVGTDWYITGKNQGIVDEIITFENIQNLIGGTDSDTFKFADQASIDGDIYGGNPPGLNFLDYTEYTTPVFVDLAANLATGTRNVYQIDGYIGPKISYFTQIYLGTLSNNFDYFYKYSPYYLYRNIFIIFADAKITYLTKSEFDKKLK